MVNCLCAAFLTIGLLTNFFFSNLLAQRSSYYWQETESKVGLHKAFSKFQEDLKTLPAEQIQAQMAAKSCQVILDLSKNIQPQDPELCQLIIASCAMSQQPAAMDLMRRVLSLSSGFDPSHWFCALQYLSRQPSQEACDLITRCLGVPYLDINLAAGFFLSQNPYAKTNEQTVSRLQAIQRRIEKPYWLALADIYSRLDHPRAVQMLRQLAQEDDIQLQAGILRLASDHSSYNFDDMALSWAARTSPLLQESAIYYALCRENVSLTLQRACLRFKNSAYPRVRTAAWLLDLKLSGGQLQVEHVVNLIRAGNIQAISGCGFLAQTSVQGLDERLLLALEEMMAHEDSKVHLNSAISLLLAAHPSCLNYLRELFCESNSLINLQEQSIASWPVFNFVNDTSETHEQACYNLAQQYQIRQWLLEKVHKIEFNLLKLWYEKVLAKCDESCHYLISSHLGRYDHPVAHELLTQWSQSPGKPWLRLGSHLSLWQLQQCEQSLQALQTWFKSSFNMPMPFLTPSVHSHSIDPQDSWLTDFQTQVVLQVGQELWKSSQKHSLMAICERIQHEPEPLHLLPLISILSNAP